MSKWMGWIIAAALVSTLAGCAREIDSGEKLPSQQGPLPSLRRTSTLAVAASIPLSRLQQLAEENAPQSWDVDKKLGVLKIKLRGRLERGAIALRPAGSRIGFESTIHGQGGAPVDWVINGVLQGALLPQVATDYQLVSNLDIRASLSEARLKLAYLPDLSLRRLLEERLASESTSLRSRLDRGLNQQGRLRSEAQRLWTAAHGVSRLGKQREAYLAYRPRAVLISSPKLDTSRSTPAVSFGLGITAELELVYGEKAPVAPRVSPLPAAIVRPIQSGTIDLRLPLIADPASLADAFSERLHKRKLKVHGSKLRITQVKAAGLGSQLVLKCRVRDERWWRPLEADLFITGTPYLDAAARNLRIRDVALTVQSRDALVGTASYLLSPLLPQYIEDNAVYPLSKLEAKARAYTDRWAADLAEKSRDAFKANITAVRVDSIAMQAGFLVVETSASGGIVTHLEPLLPSAKPAS